MATDISYFYEKDLDKTNIREFYGSLPSHLKNHFNRCNRTQILWDNVLQGYRGPPNMCNGGSGDSSTLHPSHGIQEIKFWWGARKDLNVQIPIFGTILFGVGRIVQTVTNQLDWSSLYFDIHTGECLSHDKNEAADKLNNRGCQLFEKGKYFEAAEYHRNAYQSCSDEYCNKQTFKNNENKAESELKAISLNSQADCLFEQGKYSEATDKYREAYDLSSVSTQYRTYQNNRERAEVELDALNLNSQADSLFEEGKYTEARNKYQEAYDKSKVSVQYRIYRDNREKAQLELDAIHLNALADSLFEEGHYGEARHKYQEAHDKSKVNTQNRIYRNNCEKAQVEVNAIKLSSQADNLFAQGKYNEANNKYQEAYNKSQIATQKNVYKGKKDNVQTIINNLSTLDILWQEAWDAENDVEIDRSEEAKVIFQTILSKCKSSLKIFPDNLKIKHYKVLVTLKIEGNKIFNEGLESQHNGIILFRAGRDLIQQEKYAFANVKFKEANNFFDKALGRFKTGGKSDQRFDTCAEFVQEQIDQVIESIKSTEQLMVGLGLSNVDTDIGNDMCLDAVSVLHEPGTSSEYSNHTQHI